jgi:hypothetical protein
MLFLCAAASFALAQDEPAYPRIANLYGAGLQWKDPGQGMPYWKKLGMIVGGGSDWHYDYASGGAIASHRRALATALLVRRENPSIRILPYFDMIEGPDDPSIPQAYWLRDASGKRVSTWPGFYRVDTKSAAVLDLTKGAILKWAYADKAWDGAFLDCWEPDASVVPALRAAGGGRYIVTNIGGLPRDVSPLVNGAMSEDELNVVTSGRLPFSDLMGRYLRWNELSAKPAMSIVSCYPRTIDCDPWLWAKKSRAEKRRIIDEGRNADPAMMRFGLCFTLMGEGYFAYDAGTQARGGDWWYPEFSLPLGKPEGPARELVKDFWGREFADASVRVNGSEYDESILFDRLMKDASTGRVSRSFVLPRLDGRIFMATSEAENTIPADVPRFSRSGVEKPRMEAESDGRKRWQFPDGLELYFSANGLLERASWKGVPAFRGGYPDISLKEWKPTVSRLVSEAPAPDPASASGSYIWKGRSVWAAADAAAKDLLADDWSVELSLRKDGAAAIVIRDTFAALSDFDLSMWRHFVFLPIDTWKGRAAALASEGSGVPRLLSLPMELGSGDLGNGKSLELEGEGYRLKIASGLGFGLVDHRRYNTQDYLWAGYPASGRVRKGFSVDVRLEIEIVPEEPRGMPASP